MSSCDGRVLHCFVSVGLCQYCEGSVSYEDADACPRRCSLPITSALQMLSPPTGSHDPLPTMQVDF